MLHFPSFSAASISQPLIGIRRHIELSYNGEPPKIKWSCMWNVFFPSSMGKSTPLVHAAGSKQDLWLYEALWLFWVVNSFLNGKHGRKSWVDATCVGVLLYPPVPFCLSCLLQSTCVFTVEICGQKLVQQKVTQPAQNQVFSFGTKITQEMKLVKACFFTFNPKGTALAFSCETPTTDCSIFAKECITKRPFLWTLSTPTPCKLHVFSCKRSQRWFLLDSVDFGASHWQPVT